MSTATDTASTLMSKVDRTNWITPPEGASRRAHQVYEFHNLYEVPVHTNETTVGIEHMSEERIALRLNLILEEVRELLEYGFGVATDIQFRAVTDKEYGTNLTESLRRARVTSGFDVVEAADALGDISYVVDGFALEAGIPLDSVLDEIHASNCTKPDENGRPIHREDGKVLKGPHFVEPNIENVIFKKVE